MPMQPNRGDQGEGRNVLPTLVQHHHEPTEIVIMRIETLRCPFKYASGRRCSGHIHHAKAFGPKRGFEHLVQGTVHKYRLWCSEKEDHAGINRSYAAKERMGVLP